MSKREIRAQCLVHRGNRVLMTRMNLRSRIGEIWLLPGGGVEDGETPEGGAVRELKEECCVEGRIVKELRVEDYTETSGRYKYYRTFLMDIGDQEPELGTDPDDPDQNSPMLRELQWKRLSDLSERDRAFLISSGIMSIEEFRNEILEWGSEISYPNGEGNDNGRLSSA